MATGQGEGKTLLTFRLPKTRRLIAWAEFGSTTGRPIIFFHGTPSSRLECQEFHQELCEHNIRLIAPDRPGFGRSEFQTGRSIGDYAREIVTLAQHLKLQEYVIMGGSGGGPYALACARYINPNEGLKAVAVVAGLAPFACPLKGVNWNTKLSLYMAKWTPGLLKWLSGYSLPLPKSPPTGPLEDFVVDPAVEAEVEKKIEALIKQLKPRDQQALSKPETRKGFAATLIESCVQGYSGYEHESNLFVKEWDFNLEDINFASDHARPLTLWYGTDDENATTQMGRWIADRVPGAVFREEQGETHFTLGLKFVALCEELLHLGRE
ncbi:Alpha/Beta hydrolase protein [Thelonectria olida]|uniref:Alpha/Beta hydrolase protein n=1 Tax=Thelonectria olida TaxID=1576542 RepID=A0A9P8WFL7_9HYPO|nr:Alpha/Beta hydrolase protein [Thelonectria olida]